MIPDASFFEEQPTHGRAYLSLAQQPWPTAAAESYLERMSETGFLLVPGDADVVEHGDALFQQQRATTLPESEALYWQQHARLHDLLCEQPLRHLPIRMAPDVAAPSALVWLIPAVLEGRLTAPGMNELLILDEEVRRRWLLVWAKKLSEVVRVPRLLVQLPGKGQPAHWYYKNYLGDEPIPGSPLQHVRLLLGGLPRYEAPPLLTGLQVATPRVAEQENWPLLINSSPTSWGAGLTRTRRHGEILPTGSWKY